MKLHVVHRSVGSENRKDRPAFYSKSLALASLLRAVDNLDIEAELVFVNDGEVPADRLEMMEKAGEVLTVRCGSNRSSYRRVLRLPRDRRWSPADLVWFSEDDYLYTAASLRHLILAADELDHADYFTLYSMLRFDRAATRRSPLIGPRARADGDPEAVRLDTVRWYRAVSSTSTFGARVRVLLADEWLLRTAPFVGGAWDHASCLAYQGYRPFSLREIAGQARQPGLSGLSRAAARRIALVGARTAANAVALARPESARRTLVAPDPDLVTHMEEGLLAPGTDWAALATALATGADATGIGWDG
ncbi:hypothetical protein [Frankia sp. Cppng1_Ct_nod]|uniref:hypothetical protein n=1 Tax=Frankia sp. Cppng1_Ct_nod TaxID=2897162 RepID=UPI001040F443|nr:hypothetical protein [Frankia sp. Cppng1_Ct_nod]